MLNQANIRIGFVRVLHANGKWIEFAGLPVIGRNKAGSVVNRTLLADRNCPQWFTTLARKYAGTSFRIEVRVAAMVRGDLAFVMPVAATEEEALAAWKNQHGEVSAKEASAIVLDKDYVFKAHSFIAEKNGLKITAHCDEGERSYSCAMNNDGELFKVSGGVIVNKIRDSIESGKFKWENECERFIRIRPLSV